MTPRLTYLRAVRVKQAREENTSMASIARRLQMNRRYLTNLVRLLNRLDPRIIEGWRTGDFRARTGYLLDLAALPHDEQWRYWSAAKRRTAVCICPQCGQHHTTRRRHKYERPATSLKVGV